MNKVTKFFIIPCAIAAGLVSCDNIDEDERYLPTEPVEVARMVLIEDFTGQRCRNCPDAHEVIEQLQEQYPGAIVPVSIHGGSFAISKEDTYFSDNYIGLKTDEGDAYNDSWGINEWPKGVINRRGGATKFSEWAAAVRNEVTSTPAVAIELEARVAEGELIADVTLEPQADLKGSLQLWVLESGIVARQTQPDGRTKQDYVHNNVFRASMNGHDGESVSLVRGIHQNFTSSIALRWNEQERWNPENLSVVAFVYNENGVQQVALATVAPEAD